MGRKPKPKAGRPEVRRTGGQPSGTPGWILWVVTGVTLFSGLAFLLSKVSLLDEGVLDMGAWRIAQGQIPYRDFFIPTTPLTWYLLGGVFKLLGAGFLQERIFAATVGVTLVALTLLLARRVCTSPAFVALPVAFLCQAGMSTWPFANHHWVADVLVMGSALLIDRAFESRPLPMAFSAGLLAALAFWSLHDQGLYFLVLASALAIPWRGGPMRRAIVGGWAAGLAAGLLAPAAFLLWKAGFGNLWDALVLFPLTGYRNLSGNRLGVLFPLTEIGLPWRTGAWKAAPLYYAALSATSLLIFATFFCAPVFLAWGLLKRWAPGHRLGLMTAGTLAFAGAAAHRWGPINLMWAIPFPAVVAAWTLQRWDASGSSRGGRLARPMALGFSAIFCILGILRVGSLVHTGGTQPIRSPAGTLYAQSPKQAEALQEAVERLGELIEPGAPILVTEMPLLQFMVQHPNPTRFDLFMPPDYTTPEQVEETMRALDLSGVVWVVTPRRRPSGDAFGRYLTGGFQPTWGNPACVLWRRRSGGTAAPEDFPGPAPPGGP